MSASQTTRTHSCTHLGTQTHNKAAVCSDTGWPGRCVYILWLSGPCCVCVYIKISPKGRASCVLFFQPNRIHCSEPPQPAIRAPMRVTRGPYPAIHNSLSLSLPKFLSVEGRSLLQQIHNLCNLKNTCDHESRRGE